MAHETLQDPFNVAPHLLDAMPMPLIGLSDNNTISLANSAAEQFLGLGRERLKGKTLNELLPSGSPLIHVLEHIRAKGGSITEYGLDLSLGKGRPEQIADIYAAPMVDGSGGIMLILQPRAMMDKMTRHLTHRYSARSVGAMASMLAHEIKNPLSGIRGAAQLMESSLPESEKPLSHLIRTEVDRIVRLVERFEIFSDGRPLPMSPINIYEVLDYVVRLASSGFAQDITFRTDYDPSLPLIQANRDKLIQAIINLVKNAAEAFGEQRGDACITLTTAFRPGVSVLIPNSSQRVALPFEVCILDNGPGIPDHLLPHLFEPFVTSKASGTGLGLALVAKVINDHGGVVECERHKGQTVFRLLLPIHNDRVR